MTVWSVTVDCADPARVAAFWATALGYVEAPPSPVPAGHPDWDEWLALAGDDGLDGAFLVDPDGARPALVFLQVPEPKAGKNRLHLDLRVSGGRAVAWEQRWPVVVAEVQRLRAAGATVLRQNRVGERGDSFLMADPEGNEFCVL